MNELTDADILPLSLNHTFWTWSAQAKVSPISIKRAKGVYFWDVEGKRYLDFNSMVMCVNIGHGDERVIILQKPTLTMVCGLCAGETPALQRAEIHCRAGVSPA